jgi:hypothetical protein
MIKALKNEGKAAWILISPSNKEEETVQLCAADIQVTGVSSDLSNKLEILGKHVPKKYHNFDNMFLEGKAYSLPPHRLYNHKIKLISNENLCLARYTL